MASKSWSQTQQQMSQKEKTFVSLDDVMSEQLVHKLNEQLFEEKFEPKNDEFITGFQSLFEKEECCCDALLAHHLQYEFDKEHDKELKKEEKKQNANSKVSISYDRFRRIPEEECVDSEEEEDYHEYGEESKHWDSFEKSQKQEVKIGRQGFAVKNGILTTKHDLDTNARRNACKVMEFESNVRTGDGGCFDMKLNNNVYNALKVHSINEGKRMARLHEKKEKSTAEKVLDEKSRILLFKLINRGIVETVNGVISTGKESVVLHGRGSNAEKGITGCEVAIKIFKTTLNEFRNRSQYVCSDPLLNQSSRLSKQNAKLMIPLWAEKEFHNLHRMARNGVLCPQVLALKKHILVMTFIGSEGKRAPTLKEAKLDADELSRAYKQTVEMMVSLFRDCDLIHADFSEYNLLWFKERLFCIDVSQAVFTTHSMANQFLWRDCHNVHNFFSKRCLPEVMSTQQLFTAVSGKQFCEENDCVELLDKISSFERNEELLIHGKHNNNDPFEGMLEKSLKNKT